MPYSARFSTKVMNTDQDYWPADIITFFHVKNIIKDPISCIYYILKAVGGEREREREREREGGREGGRERGRFILSTVEKA